MRNKEFTNTVLALLRQHKKNHEIAEITGRHRNTISLYVNYIRNVLVRNPEEIVNKIDSKLDEEFEQMVHKDLIAYRRVITPHKIEAKTEHREEIIKKIELDISVYSDDEKSILDRAARLLDRKSKGKSTSIH